MSMNLLTIDAYSDTLSHLDLQDIRRKLAKRANQRILRLERGSSKVTGERWNTFGAVISVYDYLDRQKKGRVRFSESKTSISDINKLAREITVLQGFLLSKSSTIKGMKEIEEKRISTFESGKWGRKWKRKGILNRALHFSSNKEFYDFLNSETFSGLVKSGFTSEQLVELYDSTRQKISEENEDDIVASAMSKALDDFREKGNASLKALRKKLNSIVIRT